MFLTFDIDIDCLKFIGSRQQRVRNLSVASMFSKAKQKAFYGKWTESFYSYDASLYDEYTARSSLSHVDRSALAHSSEIQQQEPSVS